METNCPALLNENVPVAVEVLLFEFVIFTLILPFVATAPASVEMSPAKSVADPVKVPAVVIANVRLTMLALFVLVAGE